ncbi:hypothetical protein [Actinokineospora inagensis]|uniref:hypothetical protein n=1 Tax=Actinokineospora inagensis TaxID=103730 RepID=UPI00040C993D|nr:hypothetical protein [Actinokineospora inagensis]
MSAHSSPQTFHGIPSVPGGLSGPEVLPVHPDLAALFPWGGLRRGGTVAVRGSSGLLLALLARASAEGSWVAVVGLPDLGLPAAAEAGVALERTAVVPRPGGELTAVVTALLDGFDVVVVGARVVDSLARRLSARARSRGAVLVSFGAWSGAEVELSVAGSTWSGLGEGHGHLTGRVVDVHARGRGAAARPRRARLTLTPPEFEHMFEPHGATW